jgi:hypothetical protein
MNLRRLRVRLKGGLAAPGPDSVDFPGLPGLSGVGPLPLASGFGVGYNRRRFEHP